MELSGDQDHSPFAFREPFGHARTAKEAAEVSLDQGEDFSPTKLQEVIAYVVSAVGTVGRVKLTKLIYLIDLEHFGRHGTTLTGATWVRWDHGPMIRGLKEIGGELDGFEITIREYVDGAGHQRVDYRPGSTKRFAPRLRDHEIAIVASVLDTYGKASMTRLLAVAYATPPMRLIATWEKDNELMLGTSIPFGRALGTPRTGLERFKAIADAVRQPNRGTPAERAALETEVMADLAGLRAHANREVLGTAD
jgi:uncharacterized phage-associated protein